MANSSIILTGLHDNYLRAQDAMDEYIMQTCDAEVIRPLTQQRNSAKEAYENFCKKNSIEAKL